MTEYAIYEYLNGELKSARIKEDRDAHDKISRIGRDLFIRDGFVTINNMSGFKYYSLTHNENKYDSFLVAYDGHVAFDRRRIMQLSLPVDKDMLIYSNEETRAVELRRIAERERIEAERSETAQRFLLHCVELYNNGILPERLQQLVCTPNPFDDNDQRQVYKLNDGRAIITIQDRYFLNDSEGMWCDIVGLMPNSTHNVVSF
jgi:hypothetical protein